MANFFEKVVAGIDKGVSSAKEGSKTFVEKARLNTQIQEVQKNKMTMLRNLGELVYNLQVSGVIDIEQCRGMCDEVTSFNSQIEQLQQQVEDLELKKNVPTYTAAPMAGGMTCPNCSTVNEPGAKFCAGCGMAMAGIAAPVVEEVTAAPETSVCPNCETINEPGAKFCAGCGMAMAEVAAPVVEEAPAVEEVVAAPTAPVCPNCETINEPDAKFCAGCGSPMV